MTELLRNWIVSLTGTALVCAAALRLTPEGRVKPVVRLLCGVCMAAALLSPLMGADLVETYPLELARYRARGAAIAGEGTAIRAGLDRDIIERETEAYILDKARSMGVPLTEVRVALRWSASGVWLPEGAELTGPYSAALARILEAELGIPQTAQNWREHEEP